MFLFRRGSDVESSLSLLFDGNSDCSGRVSRATIPLVDLLLPKDVLQGVRGSSDCGIPCAPALSVQTGDSFDLKES